MGTFRLDLIVSTRKYQCYTRAIDIANLSRFLYVRVFALVQGEADTGWSLRGSVRITELQVAPFESAFVQLVVCCWFNSKFCAPVATERQYK